MKIDFFLLVFFFQIKSPNVLVPVMKVSCKQTFIGIWFHDDSLTSEEQDNMKLELNQTFYYYRIFVNDKDFCQYIDPDRLVAKIFLIISIAESSKLTSLYSSAELYPQIFEKVYTYLSVSNSTFPCSNTNTTDNLFVQINKDIQDFIKRTDRLNCNRHEMDTEPILVNSYYENKPPVSLSVFNPRCQQTRPIRHLTKESLHFLCFLTMVDILRQISGYNKEELQEMWTTFRVIYQGNQTQLDYIDELEKSYEPCEAIKYYTGNSCLSRTINQACHTENMQEIFTFRGYISDLHKQLVTWHEQDKKIDLKSLITMVYRGKPLSGSVLQQLLDNAEGLISMNGFLSTTISDEVASHYHGDDQVQQVNEGYRPVLFVFELGTTIKQPYAYIGTCSTKPDELEVLFTLGSIWRIKSISINESLYIITLTSCDDLDSQTADLFNKYTNDECNFSSIGDILIALGDNDAAEWFYTKMLKQESLDNNRRQNLYFKIGNIRFDKKDYSVARDNYDKALSLLPSLTNELGTSDSFVPLYVYDNQPSSIAIHNNMAFIHANDRDFTNAIDHYNQALTVENGSKSQIATVHDNLGRLYFATSDYEKSQQNHAKAVELIDEKHAYWVEFNRNLNTVNQRCEHLKKKKQNDQTERTSIDAPAQ